MKTYREKKAEKSMNDIKKIWKYLKIDSAVKVYGIPAESSDEALQSAIDLVKKEGYQVSKIM